MLIQQQSQPQLDINQICGQIYDMLVIMSSHPKKCPNFIVSFLTCTSAHLKNTITIPFKLKISSFIRILANYIKFSGIPILHHHSEWGQLILS